MPDEHTIIDILAGEVSPGVQGWSVITLRPGGIRWQHTFPRELLEWRAAEYGLTDPAEILDIVLHEPFLPAPAPVLPPSVKGQPTPKAAPLADPHGPTLQQATSTKAARDAHRSRIAALKKDQVRLTDPEGLLSHIHRNHGMNPARVQEKQEQVDVHRWQLVYGALPVQPESPIPSTSMLEVPRA